MKGRVCLITGGTNGIGLETARALAKMGAKVVIVGRNPAKTEDTVAQLKQSTGSQHIDYLIADLSLMAQVRQLADDFKARYDRLDVLLNNAGAMFTNRQLTSEGLEMTFALNHLSYFMLTNLLLDILVDTAPARIINVSSDAHRIGELDFDNLQGEKSWHAFKIYGASKLMNILFTKELAHRLENTGVTANALHPGMVSTSFGRNNGAIWNFIFMLTRPFSKSPADGAKTSVYVASAPELTTVSGQYFDDAQLKQPSKAAYDVEAQQRLWTISEEITGVTMPALRV